MSEPVIPTLLTDKEAAELLRCTIGTIRTFRENGSLGCVKIGGRYFYTRELIAEFIEASTCPANREPRKVTGTDKSANIGLPSGPVEMRPKTLGAGPGTTDPTVIRAISALAKQTFQRRSTRCTSGTPSGTGHDMPTPRESPSTP